MRSPSTILVIMQGWWARQLITLGRLMRCGVSVNGLFWIATVMGGALLVPFEEGVAPRGG
jgi:hypothetical protein